MEPLKLFLKHGRTGYRECADPLSAAKAGLHTPLSATPKKPKNG